MAAEGDSSLKKKVEGEFSEQSVNVGKLVKTLIKSFLRADSDYGAITDIRADINRIYDTVVRYIEEEKIDVYALKLDDRILLSKTGVNFEDVYKVMKERSELQIKKDMIEIWDDPEHRILHLIVVPVRKHFPIEYSTAKEKMGLIKKISLMTWSVLPP
ncbi:hypothetical protein CW712_04210 [Candidatus Bathyarchaeota archaeon]|nr:MAG: hypothetical protein CW712_04210 [Candidatus Bathyarchaeota archaeon]